MEIPIFGKVRRPLLWALGLMGAGVIGLGAIAVVVNRDRAPAYDVAALTVPVEAQPLTVRISASGTVKPIQTVNLSPKVSGVLEDLLVEQGDEVVQGQLIAQMESRDIQAQLRQRRAAVDESAATVAEVAATVDEVAAQLQDIRQGADAEAIAQAEANMRAAESQVRDAIARLELAEAQVARNRQLQAQGAISINELDTFTQTVRSAQAALESAEFQAEEARERLADLRNDPDREDVMQAEARFDQAQARLAQARERLVQAEAQLEATEVQFADTQIRAPFGGIITQKFATEGAFVAPTTSASDATSATSTAIVALASNLEVLAEVAETDIAQIYPGQAVEIIADAYPDETFEGKVKLIAPEAIERQNVTLFQVRVELLSGQSTLLSNMNVSLAFVGDEIADALVIPTVAVVTQAGESGVLVPDDRDRIRFRPVILGSQVGDQIQVLEGVSQGERVFIDLPPGKDPNSAIFGREAAREPENP